VSAPAGTSAGSVEALQAAIAAERAELVASLERARQEVEGLRRSTMIQIGLVVAAAALGFALAKGIGWAGKRAAKKAARTAARTVARRMVDGVLR
jgi:hypothetical protein